MTFPKAKKRLRKKNNRKFCIPFSFQARHYPQGGCISLKGFCEDLFKSERVNCLHIRDISNSTPSIYINKKPIGNKKLVIRNDKALGLIKDPDYIEFYCDDLNDSHHDYISFKTSLNNITLINPLEIYGFRDTKEALDRYIKKLNSQYIKNTDPLHLHPIALTRKNYTHQIVKIIPTQVFCKSMSEYANTKFVYYVGKNQVTPVEDIAAFFTGMFRGTELGHDYSKLMLEILAPEQQLKSLTVIDEGQELTLDDYPENNEVGYSIFEPNTCTVKLRANVTGWAYWSAFEEGGNIRPVFDHPFSFYCSKLPLK